jgi:hypothetical protein
MMMTTTTGGGAATPARATATTPNKRIRTSFAARVERTCARAHARFFATQAAPLFVFLGAAGKLLFGGRLCVKRAGAKRGVLLLKSLVS